MLFSPKVINQDKRYIQNLDNRNAQFLPEFSSQSPKESVSDSKNRTLKKIQTQYKEEEPKQYILQNQN